MSTTVITTERWMPVQQYEGIYEVSDWGNVRRISGKQGTRAGRLLKPQSWGNGYLTIRLWNKGQDKTCYVHELVALGFIGTRPERNEVNHKDLDKRNNKLSNLEYVTSKENKQHASRNGAFANQRFYAARGERCGRSKLTATQVGDIRLLISTGQSLASIASMYGMRRQTIWQIKRGRTWMEVAQ